MGLKYDPTLLLIEDSDPSQMVSRDKSRMGQESCLWPISGDDKLVGQSVRKQESATSLVRSGSFGSLAAQGGHDLYTINGRRIRMSAAVDAGGHGPQHAGSMPPAPT